MRILFQGDSITDVGRSRENEAEIGMGYPLLVKAELGHESPLAYEFFNRGTSGFRIVDIYARIKADIIDLAPDVMSILVGVNDVWHEKRPFPNGIDADKYYRLYAMLIEELREALPDLKIIIMEPFVVHGTATDEDWDYFSEEVPKRAAMAKRIADTYNLPFLPLQKGFDALTELAPANYWVRDGIHPTSMGHDFIKQEWIRLFKSIV